jgi:inorganic triphosphatase YgiF
MTDVDRSFPTEVEIRFRLPAETRARLEAHPAFHPTRATAPETLRQVTTYFDTADLALAGHGVSLRVRRSGNDRVQTVKWQARDGHPAFVRREVEWPIDGDEPDLSLAAETLAPVALWDAWSAGLRPTLVTDVERVRRYLLPSADAVIEATLGEGTLSAGPVQDDIQELELELKTGRPAQLYCLALDLHASVPLSLTVESKSARGRRLAAGAAPEAHKAETLHLPRSVSVAEGFRRIMGAGLAHLLANQPAASAGVVEGVHQMRIAVRRLRSALVLFERHLDARAATEIDVELKRLGRVLGEVRDWDVFCGGILPAAEHDIPEARPRFLEGPARVERGNAQRRLAGELGGPAFTSLVLRLAVWMEDYGADTAVFSGDEAKERLADLAPQLLDRLVRKARRRGRHIRRRSIEELHGLRKSLKKLRYSIEFLSSLIGRRRSRAYLKACKDLQEQLGTINDAALATELSGRLAGTAARTTLVPALSTMPGWSREHSSRHLRQLPAAWNKFKALPTPMH